MDNKEIGSGLSSQASFMKRVAAAHRAAWVFDIEMV